MPHESLIECTTLSGGKMMLPAARLVFRPSAYGIILHSEQVVLVTNRRSGRYYLPGGGIELGERIEAALWREIREEAGLEVTEPRLIHVTDDFFYFDPTSTAYHGLLFYYACQPVTLDLSTARQVDDDEGEPRWVAVSELTADAFHNHGAQLLRVIEMARASQGKAQ